MNCGTFHHNPHHNSTFPDTFGDFKCSHCRAFVLANPIFSGVKNRNHCPYCLWSRHLDLYRPGDRLSACKAAMQPVALSIKLPVKRYQAQGELMIVHQCTECERVSINRVAADDNPQSILEIYQKSTEHDLQTIIPDIHILKTKDLDILCRQLFGGKSNIDISDWDTYSQEFMLDALMV